MADEASAREAALRSFFQEYDRAMREYEKGYVDADAALERLSRAVGELRERDR